MKREFWSWSWLGTLGTGSRRDAQSFDAWLGQGAGRLIPGRRTVSFQRTIACAVVAMALGTADVALADPPMVDPGDLQAPDLPGVGTRIPGEGVIEDPPEAIEEEDRRARPLPDAGGCPYRARRLELIV